MTERQSQTIGIFTGGGIAPGLNSVISRATTTLKEHGHKVIGIPDGWAGLLEKRSDVVDLSGMSRRLINELLRKPGTILGSSRTKIKPEKHDQVRQTVAEYGLNGLIAIGGDDTLGQARELHEAKILNVVGVPKTIDNDIIGTDRTFGFETAYHACAERIRSMRHDAESMRRIAFVELMGRKAGWITLYAGKAGAADMTLLREFPIPEAELMERINDIYYDKQGNGHPQRHAVIAVAEGYEHEGTSSEDHSKVDSFGHVKLQGIARNLAKVVEDKLHLDTQVEVVGYHARNGEPVASDAIFASELGAIAGRLAAQEMYGRMVALQGGKFTTIPLSQVAGGRFVTGDFYDRATLGMKDIPFSIDNGAFALQDDLADKID